MIFFTDSGIGTQVTGPAPEPKPLPDFVMIDPLRTHETPAAPPAETAPHGRTA